MTAIYTFILFLFRCVIQILPKAGYFKTHLEKSKNLLREQTSQSPNWNSKESLWIHAASGEIEYAKPLIAELVELRKKGEFNMNIVLSYTSPSFPALIKGFQSEVILFPYPWDFRRLTEQAFKFFSPRVALVFRGDHWPLFGRICHLFGVPLISVAVSRPRGKFGRRAGFFARWRLKYIQQFLTLTPEDVSYFESLGPTQYLGNPRIDQVFLRLEQNRISENLHSLLSTHRSPMAAIGSTWPEDVQEIKVWANEWLAKGGLLLWAPHLTEEVSVIRNLFSDKKTLLWSELINSSQISDIEGGTLILIDQMGWLAELYKYADIAFVGGSFRARVHSVLEPLAAGVPVWVGPYYENSPECRQGIQNKTVYTVDNGLQLAAAMAERPWAKLSPLQREDAVLKLSKERGATQRLLSLVTHLTCQKVNQRY